MSTMPSKNFFPEFVPNQILTNVQLNDLREYLDDQNHLTRVRLTGTGIACGLEATVDNSGANPVVNITEGFGVTSDGYIIEIPAMKLVEKRTYLDPNRISYVSKTDDNDAAEIGIPVYGPAYRPWRLEKDEIDLLVPANLPDDPSGNPVTQINITELITQEIANEDISTTLLQDADFQDHVLVLYLEILKEDLKSCLTTDCNNKGQNLAFAVRVLLIHRDEFQPVSPCKGWSNLVVLPRYHRGLRQAGVGEIKDIDSKAELNAGYEQIVQSVAQPMFVKIENRYNEINPFLQLNIDFSALKNRWNQVLLNNNQQQLVINQYHYDFLRDVACAYNEFLAHYCRIIDNCCPQLDFPRHLMLRDFDGEPAPYRHDFQPSPVRNVMHHDLKKAKRLFLRIEELILNFDLSLNRGVKITPSQNDRYTLGEKAIPHYYDLAIKDIWQPEACCRDPRLLSYSENFAGNPDPDNNDFDLDHYQSMPLETLIDKNSFFRIEGHLGQQCSDALVKIEDIRKYFNLDFEVKLLHLDAQNQAQNDKDDCDENFKDILAEIDKIKAEIARIISSGKADPDNLAGAQDALNSYYKKLQSIKGDWEKERVANNNHCDLTHLRMDYLNVRSRAICTFDGIKKMVENLSDLDQQLPQSNLGNVANTTKKRKAAEARITEVEMTLKTADLDAVKKQNLLLEKVRLNSQREQLFRMENTLKVSANIASTIHQRTAARNINTNARMAVNFVAANSNDFGQLVIKTLVLNVVNLKDDLEKLCEQLPKDAKKFNYCLFKYYYKKLIVNILETKLLISVLLDFVVFTFGNLQFLKTYVTTYLLQWIGGHLAEITDFNNALQKAQYNCFQAEFGTIYYTLNHLLQGSEASFQNFAAANIGMEHLAGVERGNTFLLVCDKDEVVADFTLHSSLGCCCDFAPEALCLPPIALVDYKVIRLKLDGKGNIEDKEIDELIDVLPNDFNLGEQSPLILKLVSDKSDLAEQNGLDANLSIFPVDAPGKYIRYKLQKPIFGLDSFKYQLVSKECGLVDEGEVLVLIRPESEQPLITQEDIAATSQNQPIDVDVALNDFGEGTLFDDDYALTLINPAPIMGGTVEVKTDNLRGLTRPVIRYTPPNNFVGRDTFLYKVTANGREATGQVTVLIVPCCDDNGRIDTGLTVFGTVKDIFGEDAIGASIILKGSTMGTIADIDGKYSINLPPGSHTLMASYTGFATQTKEVQARSNGPNNPVDFVLGFKSFVGPLTATDLRPFVTAIFTGDDLKEKDPSDEVIKTFDIRHNDRLTILENARENEVVKTTEAFNKADVFLSKTMLNADKTPEELATEYEEITTELVDAHKISSGDDKKAYKSLLETTTHAFMDKMVIKNPNEIEPTMKVALENSTAKIKLENISLVTIKREFGGKELTKNVDIKVVKDLNKLLK